VNTYGKIYWRRISKEVALAITKNSSRATLLLYGKKQVLMNYPIQ
jgi:hypothetical protein